MMLIGIDPHKGSHTAVVVDRDERVVDEIRVRASPDQIGELREWASAYDERCWAVESARGMGYLVAQQLVAAGERVIDVPARWRRGFGCWVQASHRRLIRMMPVR